MTDLPPDDKPKEAPVVRCAMCGAPYAWPTARYCPTCKTYKSAVRQWFTNFNAAGWTAFIAVAGLTATTAVGLYNGFVDNVEVQQSACRPHQLIVTVVNGEDRGVILASPRMDVLYDLGGKPGQKSTDRVRLLTDAKLPPGGDPSTHLESDFVPASGRAYASLAFELTDMPSPPEGADNCRARFWVAYAYSPYAKPKPREVGECPCAVLLS